MKKALLLFLPISAFAQDISFTSEEQVYNMGELIKLDYSATSDPDTFEHVDFAPSDEHRLIGWTVGKQSQISYEEGHRSRMLRERRTYYATEPGEYSVHSWMIDGNGDTSNTTIVQFSVVAGDMTEEQIEQFGLSIQLGEVQKSIGAKRITWLDNQAFLEEKDDEGHWTVVRRISPEELEEIISTL
ncbi:MAG: hypothetical protein HWD92_06530 [Flavobacteriia bacterium]|nr:hypothetical protein [Flavobacteriia bacterium]